MFVKYTTVSAWTAIGVSNDIARLLTGADISTMSASCNIAASTQSGIGGYTMYDTAAGGTSHYVITATDVDNKSTKYYKIQLPNTTTIQVLVANDWNTSTDTATNISTACSITVTASVANTIYIMTSGTEWFAICSGISLGILGGEVLRDSVFIQDHNTLGVQRVHFSWLCGASMSGTCYLPITRNITTPATTQITGSAKFYIGALCSNSGAWPAVDLYDNNQNPVINTAPIAAFSNTGYGFIGRVRSTVPLLAGHSAYGTAAFGDTINVGGQQYFITNGLLLPIIV